ncbi:MAG: hypothetical protein ABSG42_07675 [Nitrospirota bacterium]
MKFRPLTVAAIAIVFLSLACARADRPSKSDVDSLVKTIPLQDLVIEKTEGAGTDKNGRYTIGAWGQAKDGGEPLNLYAVLIFDKSDKGWTGHIPAYGLVAQPVKEKDKDAFYQSTRTDWEKLKVDIKNGKAAD